MSSATVFPLNPSMILLEGNVPVELQSQISGFPVTAAPIFVSSSAHPRTESLGCRGLVTGRFSSPLCRDRKIPTETTG